MKGLNIFLCWDSANFIAHFASYKNLTSSVLLLDGVDQLWFCRMAELGFAVGLLAPYDLWPAMACWGFGIGSGFRGLVHSGVGLVSIFGEFSFSAGGAFILAGGLGTGLSFLGV